MTRRFAVALAAAVAVITAAWLAPQVRTALAGDRAVSAARAASLPVRCQLPARAALVSLSVASPRYTVLLAGQATRWRLCLPRPGGSVVESADSRLFAGPGVRILEWTVKGGSAVTVQQLPPGWRVVPGRWAP